MVKGTFNERVNRFMQMSLKWQEDLNRGIKRPCSYYQKTFHVGMTPKEMFQDIQKVCIDRQWVISTMEKIAKMKKQESIRYKERKNKLQLQLFNDHKVEVNVETTSKKSKHITEFDTNELINEVCKRGFVVFKQYGEIN